MAYYLPWGTSLASGGGGADPYVWFSGLDLSQIPFTVNEAAAPTTTTNVTAATWSDIETYAALGSRRITLTASIDAGGAYITDPITDVDIVVPSGIVLKNAGFGNIGDGSSGVTRFRIRGSTVGSDSSGGQIHHIDIVNPIDAIVEGVACSGLTDNNYSLYFRRFGTAGASSARCAVHNCKAHCGSYWLLADVDDLIVVNNSVMTGAEAPSVPGDATEAWGIRIGGISAGYHVIYGNDIRSSTVRGAAEGHMRVRMHPSANNPCKVWISGNRFLNNSDGRMIWSHSAAGNGDVGGNAYDVGDWDEIYIDDNEFYCNTSGVSFIVNDFLMARVRNNTIYATNWTSDSQISFTGEAPSAGPPINEGSDSVPDTATSGNTYNAYSAPSGWIGPGDPTGIDWTP
jgi:hypothetical protein